MQLSIFEQGAAALSERPLSSYVHRVISHDDQTGECVLDVRVDGEARLVKGRCASVWAGQSFATGSAVEFVFGAPPTARLLKKFLKSGAFGRLGKKTAEALSSCSAEFFDFLARDPSRLLSVEGIGRKKLADLLARYQAFLETCARREFLFAHGLPLSWVFSVDDFCLRPYAYVSESRSFAQIDAFALARGFALDSHERLSAGLDDLIRAHEAQGHCAYPDAQLLDDASTLLGSRLVEDELEHALVSGRYTADDVEGVPCIYRTQVWQMERAVAEKFLALGESVPSHSPLNAAKTVAWAQRTLDLHLSPSQCRAVEMALESSLSVITGGPGTGKTTLVRCLVTTLNSQFSRYALCAPTGRAAQRLRESTGAQAVTLHRLLKFDGVKFAHSRDNPLALDFVLVDEASMIDLTLMSRLLDALPAGCSLVLVGDANQLPSVGAGTVLRSLISSGRFPVVVLNEVFRQGAESQIRKNAERIHRGELPANGRDFRGIAVTRENAVDQLRDVLLNVLPREFGVSDLNRVQILTPTNRGEHGTAALNTQLRELFTGSEPVVGFRGEELRIGDKVIMTRNDYAKNVYNGDIGRVIRVAHDHTEIDFGDRVAAFYPDELQALSLAYAISIHKSQGSEYNAVVILLTDEHVSRHLVYTAVTRGKEVVILLAEPRALRAAVARSDQRWQKLTELLKV